MMYLITASGLPSTSGRSISNACRYIGIILGLVTRANSQTSSRSSTGRSLNRENVGDGWLGGFDSAIAGGTPSCSNDG